MSPQLHRCTQGVCVKRGNVFPLELERSALGEAAAAGASGAAGPGPAAGAEEDGSLAARTPEEGDVVDVGVEQEGEEEQGQEPEGAGAGEEQGRGGGDEGPERKRVRR